MLLSTTLLLVSGCEAEEGDRVQFDRRRDDSGGFRPVVTHDVSAYENGTNYALFWITPWVAWEARQSVAWEARAPLPNERLTLISHRDDGYARAATTTIDAAAFDGVALPAPKDPVFASDGKLIGFCALDTCGAPRACVSAVSVVAQSALARIYHAMRGIFWADSTGDGLADATVVNTSGVYVGRSTSLGANPPELWVPNPYYGFLQNVLGDIGGDGLADLLVVNPDGVHARFSNSAEYTSQAYVSSPFDGAHDTLLAEVDGMPGADLVLPTSQSILVRRSTGTSFEESATWSPLDPGWRGIALADATGDGKADAIVVRDRTVEVLESTGSAFGAPFTWLAGVAAGAPGWFFADVTGDGTADAIVLDDARAEVFPSDGSTFSRPPSPWAELPLGERGNAFADVTGDGMADAIVHDNTSVLVHESTGTGFATPRTWIAGAFYGGL